MWRSDFGVLALCLTSWLVPFLVHLRCDTQCERRAPGTHIHLMARDPDEHKRLCVGVLDAEVTHSGSLELLKIPFAS